MQNPIKFILQTHFDIVVMSYSNNNLYAKFNLRGDIAEWVNLQFSEWTAKQWRDYRKDRPTSLPWSEEDAKMELRDDSLGLLNECRNSCNEAIFRIWEAKSATEEERLFIDWLLERELCSCMCHDCHYYYEMYLFDYEAIHSSNSL